MPTLLEGIGKSSAVADINTALTGALNVRREATAEAVSAERLKMDVAEQAVRLPGVAAETALSQEKLKAYKEAREFNSQPVRLKENAYLTRMLGPEGAAEAAKDMESMGYAKDGVTTVERFGQGVAHILSDDEKWAGYRKRAVEYHSTLLNQAAEEVEKLKEKSAADPSNQELFNKLQEAKKNEEEIRKKSTIVDKSLLTVDRQREMQKILLDIRKSGPEGERVISAISRDPVAQFYAKQGDVPNFAKAVDAIRRSKLVPVVQPDGSVAYEATYGAVGAEPGVMPEKKLAATTKERVAEVAASAKRESARIKAAETAKKDDTKAQGVMLNQFKADVKTILDKYKMTGENKQQMIKDAETGQFALAKTSLTPEQYTKYVNEVTAAQKRYDDRYEKKYGERPFGTTATGAAKGPQRLKFDAEGNLVK